MKTAPLERIASGDSDARHHLTAGDECRKQRFAIGLFIFRHGEGWQKSRRAGMNTCSGLADIVEFEGMGHGAIGQGGTFRRRFLLGAEDGGVAFRAGAADKFADGFAPRLGRAIERNGQSIEDARLGALDHFAGNVAVA